MEAQYGRFVLANYQYGGPQAAASSQRLTPRTPKPPTTAPSGSAPCTYRELQLTPESRSSCTSNEPSIAPANPVPLPSSRFFSNPRSRLYRSPPPPGAFLAQRALAVQQQARARTVPPPQTLLVTSPAGSLQGTPTRAAPLAALSSPPSTSLSFQGPTPPKPAPQRDPGGADLPLPPPSTAPTREPSSPPMALGEEEMQPPAAELVQPPSIEEPMEPQQAAALEAAVQQPPPTPERQSSTCSTDTPSGNARINVQLEEQSAPLPGEEVAVKASPGEAVAADVGAEGEQATTATEEPSKADECEIIARTGEQEEQEKVVEEEGAQEEKKPDDEVAKVDSRERQPSESGAPVLAIDTVHKKQKQVILADVEGSIMLVSSSLDKFFDNDKMWQSVQREVAGLSAKAMSSTRSVGSARSGKVKGLSSLREVNRNETERSNKAGGTGFFRVQVPRPYPGVQYRKSKRLDDRYPRFAEKGSIVEGVVEEEGEWLRTNGHGYLPMKVGGKGVIVPLDPDAARREASLRENQESWCLCGSSHVEPSWPPEDFAQDPTSEGDEPDPYRRLSA